MLCVLIAAGVGVSRLGIPAYDALHLACAESAEADVFLTTDDKLIHKSTAHAEHLRIHVKNPLAWVEEVIV